VAGFLVVGSVYFWDRAKVDDPCGAISVHGVCGAWGVLALGIFADGTYGAGWNGIAGNVKGLLYGDFSQFGAQVVDVVVGFAWAFGITYLLFAIVRQFVQIRVSPEVELEGLDVPEFGVECYPDFVLHPSAGPVGEDVVTAARRTRPSGARANGDT
jgi:Amt family ammonium transporter